MSAAVDRIITDLTELGLEPELCNRLNEQVIVFRYTIKEGQHAGASLPVGIGMEGVDFPECPPHWVHVPREYSDGRNDASDKPYEVDGQAWLAMSRPPYDGLWEKLPCKTIEAYISLHLDRLWRSR